jgi:hypothetical protein
VPICDDGHALSGPDRLDDLPVSIALHEHSVPRILLLYRNSLGVPRNMRAGP